MKWKQQVGGILTLAGLAVMAGASGWWWLTRGGVIDRVELFSQKKVMVVNTGRFKADIGIGDRERGAWELGPYTLGPEDSPISITGTFNAVGTLSTRKPTFTLKAYLFDEDDEQIWEGKSKISWGNRESDSEISGVELSLGMARIRESGEYTLYCNTDEAFSRMGGVGTGAMKLDLVIRRQAKSFPFIPVIGGFVVLLIAIFGFGESAKQ